MSRDCQKAWFLEKCKHKREVKMDQKKWWTITTCAADVDAGYTAVTETVTGNLLALSFAVKQIENKHGVPDYRLDVTEHWIDEDGEHSDFYGTAEEYLIGDDEIIAYQDWNDGKHFFCADCADADEGGKQLTKKMCEEIDTKMICEDCGERILNLSE